jgi:signal transduction histidine kinase
MQAGKPVIGRGSCDEVATPGARLHREASSAEYEFSPVAQVALDRNGRIRRINHAAADLLKGSASQLLEVPFVACVDRSYCRVFLDHLTTCFNLRAAIWSEIVLANFARCRTPIELRSLPGIDPVTGDVFCRTALLPRDVSERHQMEADLHQAKDLFSQILANNAIATAIISIKARRFVTANQMFYDLIGLNERDVAGLSALEIGLGVLKEGKETGIEELWSNDGNHDIECSLVTPDHGTIDVLATTRVMIFRGGPCALLTVQDLSDLKRLKHDLIEISEEERRRFGRDLHDSHCQDLTAIIFYAETIAATLADKDAEIAGQIRTLAGMVRRSAESAHRLAAGLGGSVLEQYGLPHASKSWHLTRGSATALIARSPSKE